MNDPFKLSKQELSKAMRKAIKSIRRKGKAR